jgi:hypothetical protein
MRRLPIQLALFTALGLVWGALLDAFLRAQTFRGLVLISHSDGTRGPLLDALQEEVLLLCSLLQALIRLVVRFAKQKLLLDVCFHLLLRLLLEHIFLTCEGQWLILHPMIFNC